MGERQGKTKRQHYVPRFLLRNFSLDDQRRMICVRTPERTILDASLRDQCYSDNFYGADGTVEAALAKLEASIAPILSAPSAQKLAELSDADVESLIWFVGFQAARTRSTADFRSQITDRMLRQLVRVGRSSGIGPDISEKDPPPSRSRTRLRR